MRLSFSTSQEKIFAVTNFHDLAFDCENRENFCLAKISCYTVGYHLFTSLLAHRRYAKLCEYCVDNSSTTFLIHPTYLIKDNPFEWRNSCWESLHQRKHWYISEVTMVTMLESFLWLHALIGGCCVVESLKLVWTCVCVRVWMCVCVCVCVCVCLWGGNRHWNIPAQYIMASLAIFSLHVHKLSQPMECISTYYLLTSACCNHYCNLRK